MDAVRTGDVGFLGELVAQVPGGGEQFADVGSLLLQDQDEAIGMLDMETRPAASGEAADLLPFRGGWPAVERLKEFLDARRGASDELRSAVPVDSRLVGLIFF